MDGGETLEYIECTVADYRLAHELLSDGVLDNTLDDLPRPARELLELIKKYVTDKADAEGVVAEQVVFQRSQIRAYTSWSFAQIRNNFRTLADYEYIQLIKARSGLANQYRLSAPLQRPRFPHHDPQPRGSDCEDKGPTCRCGRGDLNELNTPEHSGSDALTNSPARR